MSLALVAPFALGADQSVTATTSNQFVQRDVTVDVGDTVTWTNAGGLHNVKFDDGSFEQPADVRGDNWTVSRTFDTAGTFRYYCELHGGPNGADMAGSVTVNPGVTVPTIDPPVGTEIAPAPPPPAAPTSEPEPPAPDTTGAVVSRFSMTRTRFQVGSGRTAGSRFRFGLSEPATVRIAIERVLAGRRVGGRCRAPAARNRGPQRCTRSLAVATLIRPDRAAGTNTITFSGRIRGRALRPGRYRATISATDAAGNRSRIARQAFRVVAR